MARSADRPGHDVRSAKASGNRAFAQDAALRRLLALVVVTITACSTPQPVPLTPPKDAASSPVVRKPIAEPPPAMAAAPATQSSAAAPPIAVPPGTQYICASETDGVRTQTSIAFVPKVAQLCLRHPEMGPCQYERNLCRRSGGRVYAAGGAEITMDTEAEYDRRVLRVRFLSN